MRLWRKAAGELKPLCLGMECRNFSAASMTPSIRESYHLNAHDCYFESISFKLSFSCYFFRVLCIAHLQFAHG